MENSSPKSVDAIRALAVTLIWWPAIFLTLLNYSHFTEQHILLAFARSLGLDHSRELTSGQLLLVYSKTILFAGVILPLFTFLAARFLPIKTVIKVVMVGSVLLVLLNYINLLTVAETGSLMRFEFLLESAQTGIREPEFARIYVSTSSLVKLLLVLASVYAIGVINLSICARRLTGPTKNLVAAPLIVLAAIFPSIYVYATVSSDTELNPGVEFLSKQVAAFLNLDEDAASDFDGFTVDQAISFFRGKVSSPSLTFNDLYKSKESGSNLIVISLESGPAQVIDYLSNERFSNLRTLAEKSFIGMHHYSTYPYTSDALFSIFTGLYPSDLRRSLLTESALSLDNRLKENRIGMFHALNRAGYESKIYFSEAPLFAPDVAMFAVLGADQAFVPPDTQLPPSRDYKSAASAENSAPDSGSESMLNRYMRLDGVSLDQLLDDIQNNARSKNKFALVFMPLSGHGPWPDSESGLSLLEEGKKIFLMQDEWIGKIVRKLEEEGIADETVIVITSDHGLRTRSEYPSLEPGVLNEISFLVPLLIHAPNALAKKVEIDHVTSHIDIAPSILSLLGIDLSAMFMVGSPVWAAGMEDRRTYLLANDYSGVDGYFEHGRYSILQHMSGIGAMGDRLYANGSSFHVKPVIAEGGDEISDNISLLRSLQKAIQEYALSPKPR